MNIALLIVLPFLVVAAYGDCGCLKCGKNLRVVSPPAAPVTVIYRGQSCNCPKPIPYKIEIPKDPICKICPLRTYGYQLQTVNCVKPNQCKYSYGYDVEVPVEKHCGTKYLVGLVAATDRMVMPAVDDCIPEKPSSAGPTIEYIQPCKDDDSYFHHRQKRAIFTREDIQSLRQSEENHNFILFPRKYKSQPLKNKFRSRPETQRKSDKPFRITIPLETKRRFFPYRKSIPKFKQTERAIGTFGFEENLALSKEKKFTDFNAIKIPNLQKKYREKRSFTIEDSLPFYEISESSGEEFVGDRFGDNEVTLESKRKRKSEEFMTPFNLENLIPQDQLFYVLNAPIRMLSQVHKLKEHIFPVFKSVPKVLHSSNNYMEKFVKQMKMDVLDVTGNVLNAFKFFPGKAFLNLLRTSKRYKRNINKKMVSRKHQSINFNQNRFKRAIVKVVDEDDVHAFLREKLSIFSSDEEEEDDVEDILKPVMYESIEKKNKNLRKMLPRELVLKKLQPKLLVGSGKPMVDVNGLKKPIEFPKRKSNKISKIKRPRDESNNADVINSIADVIEDVKLMAVQSSTKSKKMDMPLRIIKSKISQILADIQTLIDANVDINSHVYQNLLKLQNLKNVVTDDWKNILISKRHNGVNEKIDILNKIHEIQSLKEAVVTGIAEDLIHESVDTKKLIKILVRLQKLQCVLIRIVEYFSERVRYKTPFDVQKEIKYVDYLHNVKFVDGKNCIEIGNELRKERETRVEKEIRLLEKLRNLMEVESCEENSFRIDAAAKFLWEIKNIEKLQRDTISELYEKIQDGHKIRRELKIIFDLQKQLEDCEMKLDDVLKWNSEEINSTPAPIIETTEPVVGKKARLKKLRRHVFPDNKFSLNLFKNKPKLIKNRY